MSRLPAWVSPSILETTSCCGRHPGGDCRSSSRSSHGQTLPASPAVADEEAECAASLGPSMRSRRCSNLSRARRPAGAGASGPVAGPCDCGSAVVAPPTAPAGRRSLRHSQREAAPRSPRRACEHLQFGRVGRAVARHLLPQCGVYLGVCAGAPALRGKRDTPTRSVCNFLAHPGRDGLDFRALCRAGHDADRMRAAW